MLLSAWTMSHSTLKPILQAAKSRSSREKHGLILLEGQRLITDSILSGADLKYVYFNRYENLEHLPIEKTSAQYYKMKYQHLKLWSALQTPPAVMAVCQIPHLTEPLYEREALPLTLVCDNIRDPGNMGTLLRSAAAAGCRQVIATKGCADVWEPKVLRSGSGSHFQIPIHQSVTWECIQNYVSEKPAVFLADHKDSLHKQALAHTQQQDAHLYANTIEVIQTDSGEKVVNYDYIDENAAQYADTTFASHAFYEAEYGSTDGETVLVVGGETEGLSGSACRFAHDNYGCKVHIPMVQSMDSLNSSIAGSIILFEIKRQLSVKLMESSV